MKLYDYGAIKMNGKEIKMEEYKVRQLNGI
ncbi:MAG: hypothetical protein A370_02709 [Clostridium sp. Maddingley MBC34-26]|nr:MAG: hypothetical protein A370_02709 [Clostridium sp. Maddingley MBC34-26]